MRMTGNHLNFFVWSGTLNKGSNFCMILKKQLPYFPKTSIILPKWRNFVKFCHNPVSEQLKHNENCKTFCRQNNNHIYYFIHNSLFYLLCSSIYTIWFTNLITFKTKLFLTTKKNKNKNV